MDHLSFRQLGLDDTDEYYDVFDANRMHFDRHDPLLSKSFLTLGGVAEQLSPWNARHRQHFGIFEDGALIGSTALFVHRDDSAELTYWLDEAFTGKRLGATACAMTINHGIQNLGRRRFEANILSSNAASIRTVQKLGFQLVATYERDVVYQLDINRS